MKTKNKKILTRLSAVLATCLLLVALAVPCFADGVVSDESYCLKQITFTDNSSLFDWLLDNYQFVDRMELSIANFFSIVVRGLEPLYDGPSINVPTVFNYYNIAPGTIGETNGSFGIYNGYIRSDHMEVYNQYCYFEVDDDEGNVTVSYSGIEGETIPSEYWETAGLTVVVTYFEEFTPTVAPIDPDAPTRTGLYGELYHIIRDAIYGENAFLDSTQEFTLTQIATWMTYIVILLPLVVIAIILFKIFVR